MSTPLQGIKVLDFTGVRNLAHLVLKRWPGLALTLLKFECPGVGDVTRHQSARYS